MALVSHLLLLTAIQSAAITPQLVSTQNLEAQSGPTTGSSRPCTANPVLGSNSKPKLSKKSKHAIAPEPPPACLELKGEPIEVQEFLQTVVREFQWRVGENHASEDTWSFVRYLNEEELEHYADTKVLVEPVQFTGGKVAVLVRTQDVGDSYVRVQIITHFQGNGKSTDKLSGQPATLWPLNSKGTLEEELMGALKARFHHAS
jgi:hypothetical protein